MLYQDYRVGDGKRHATLEIVVQIQDDCILQESDRTIRRVNLPEIGDEYRNRNNPLIILITS